jgi:outer membrane protein OmpA-like peptidoglycan-associated protein
MMYHQANTIYRGSVATTNDQSLLQNKSVNKKESMAVPPAVYEVLHSPGRPLESNTRQAMEANFGQDLSQVRTHTDDKAADSAAAINAQAYTFGNNIVFGKGNLAPDSVEGDQLLAHELTHVTQQASSNTSQTAANLVISDVTDPLEQAADKKAEEIVAGEKLTENQNPILSPPMGLIQRVPLPGNIDTTLRVSPFMARSMGSLTLTNFALNSATLTSTHQDQLTDLAATISRLLRQYPGGMISIAGHTDATGSEEHNLGLGQQRADAARDALVAAGVSADIITTTSAGETSLRVDTQQAEGVNRRVEITFQPEPIASFGVPPLTLRSPQPVQPPPDLRFRPPPLTPETVEERIERILREPIPEPRQRRSFNDLFWRRINDGLDSAMSRANVPEELRGLIRRGVRAGIERGARAIVDEVLDAANIQGEAREAVESVIRSAGEVPLFD